ncbi:probable polyol transporter 6 [Dioscorea cayenensis subsp. rotundata]|uniref:Probable polyol transporter 6 n=1 Tax=Dioscorea cayennensis subsp. rotundata TaxID=55577 RepID=A0AB40AJG0_DIOCR|nr:probable polyol transporter 6 [Dioscorea cayenensis subsp. rotundata]
MEMKGKEKRNKYACACSIVASMISLLLGYDTGVMSGAMLFIKEDLKISDVQVEVLAGILNLCALIGSLTAGRASDWIGRRYTIVLASVIFFIGALLMGLAPSYAILITGRCVAGVGVGYALMIAPVYSAEISSPSFRGFLTSMPEICISLGILLGYISNYLFAKLPLMYGWRTMLGIGAVPSLMLAVGILAMPESPRWLVMQGRLKEAQEVMLKVSNSEDEAELRFQEIKTAAGIDHESELPKRPTGEGVWKELLLRPPPPVRRILIAGIGIHFFEHATGIEPVVLYSPRIFKMAGIQSKNKLLIATIGVGVTKTLFIFVATFLIDKVGRRPLLLTSVGGMIVSLSGLGFGLTMVEHSEEKLIWALALCIACLITFVAFYSIGLGPITWVYSSEIFPMRLRAQGASLGVAVNRVMNGTTSMTFMSLYKAITIGGSFFMFSGIAVLAWFFFFFFCPETRGRSLEEMEEVFSHAWWSTPKPVKKDGHEMELTS